MCMLSNTTKLSVSKHPCLVVSKNNMFDSNPSSAQRKFFCAEADASAVAHETTERACHFHFDTITWKRYCQPHQWHPLRNCWVPRKSTAAQGQRIWHWFFRCNEAPSRTKITWDHELRGKWSQQIFESSHKWRIKDKRESKKNRTWIMPRNCCGP